MIIKNGSTDPYTSFKRGIISDVIGNISALVGSLTVFLLIVFLIMVLRQAVVASSGLSDMERLGCIIFLCIVVPCMFFTRTSNFIIMIWGFLVFLVIVGFFLLVIGYMIYISFGSAFELI